MAEQEEESFAARKRTESLPAPSRKESQRERTAPATYGATLGIEQSESVHHDEAHAAVECVDDNDEERATADDVKNAIKRGKQRAKT